MTGTACELCGSGEYRILYKGAGEGLTAADFKITKSVLKKGPVVKCLGCGLARAGEMQDHRRFYEQVTDEQYEKDRASRLKEFQPAFERLEQCGRARGGRKKILDVGCMTGILLEFLRSCPGREISAEGVEPSGWAAGVCRDKGLSVTQGCFEDVPLPAGEYDAVTMFDVLEHVPFPRIFLRKAREILKPGGLLLITTPDFGSLYRRLFRRHYWFIEAMHLHYFTRPTLKALLEKGGFRVLRVQRHDKVLKLNYALARLKGAVPFFRFLPSGLPRAIGGEADVRFYAGQMLVIAERV
ncbi:MAG: methyltransferase domain-containing protein [Candidatus Omnitrophota bacterium]|nr:methyltransferase domain-containing protein [Candidatus Omnitrophota bacterium]MDZ4241939.1 methyltransferase domain-containing protein [Candidatus Omnitrophota bacterium]